MEDEIAILTSFMMRSKVGQKGMKVPFCVFPEPLVTVLKLKNEQFFNGSLGPFFWYSDRIRRH